MRRTVLVVAAATLVAGCARGSGRPEYAIDRPPAEKADTVALTLEEAGLLASGALIDIYGLDADPVPVRVIGDQEAIDGQITWRLDLTVDVTVDDVRVSRRWQMWVGTPTDGAPAVLRAEETG